MNIANKCTENDNRTTKTKPTWFTAYGYVHVSALDK